MAYCPKCGKTVSGGAAFCPSCGSRLVDESVVSPVSLVYLFGDLVASKPRLGGFQVPCTDKKVKHSEVANTMFMAAFLSMSRDGIVDISLAEKNSLFRKTIDAYVTLRDEASPMNLGDLEQKIYNKIKQDKDKSLVYDVVRLIVEEASNPWVNFVNTIEKEIVELGLLKRVSRGLLRSDELVFSCQEIEKYKEDALKIRSLLDEWRVKKPELCKKLWERIDSGFKANIEQD
ncbi:MAG: zinc ribbon domain-containing protein [Candidatus Bathyarchaeota archaeon]|nr:zinc ribbon domain-containing protein [Candidatus Bathyarchaeota archaeon]